MEELVKYFEALEARISALEQQQAQLLEKQTANEEKLKVMGDKILAVGSRISKMVTIIQEAKTQQQVVVKEEEPEYEPEEPEVEEEEVAEPEPEAEPQQPQQELFVEPEPVKEVPVAEESASSKAMLYGKPVSDIRQAISLGDRFLYQRELFGQNAELMQKTLNDLNTLRSFDEAISYIMTHFKWDAESSTYQQFLVTLHRRFG